MASELTNFGLSSVFKASKSSSALVDIKSEVESSMTNYVTSLDFTILSFLSTGECIYHSKSTANLGPLGGVENGRYSDVFDTMKASAESTNRGGGGFMLLDLISESSGGVSSILVQVSPILVTESSGSFFFISVFNDEKTRDIESHVLERPECGYDAMDSCSLQFSRFLHGMALKEFSIEASKLPLSTGFMDTAIDRVWTDLETSEGSLFLKENDSNEDFKFEMTLIDTNGKIVRSGQHPEIEGQTLTDLFTSWGVTADQDPTAFRSRLSSRSSHFLQYKWKITSTSSVVDVVSRVTKVVVPADPVDLSKPKQSLFVLVPVVKEHRYGIDWCHRDNPSGCAIHNIETLMGYVEGILLSDETIVADESWLKDYFWDNKDDFSFNGEFSIMLLSHNQKNILKDSLSNGLAGMDISDWDLVSHLAKPVGPRPYWVSVGNFPPLFKSTPTNYIIRIQPVHIAAFEKTFYVAAAMGKDLEPLELPCNPSKNLPCNVQNSRALVSWLAVSLNSATTSEEVDNLFSDVQNNPSKLDIPNGGFMVAFDDQGLTLMHGEVALGESGTDLLEDTYDEFYTASKSLTGEFIPYIPFYDKSQQKISYIMEASAFGRYYILGYGYLDSVLSTVSAVSTEHISFSGISSMESIIGSIASEFIRSDKATVSLVQKIYCDCYFFFEWRFKKLFL
eukprot:TRINITY_DN3505_c0_g4_i2.p1 TRINITY_DN3505_c0_g4~~TRINITY_DN3505_c0_g4_i2.p1  ORF type:complete len:720 (+),score=182.04 TRINITY_DN3505_c0_g4_i2:128-2161(+)